MGKLTFYYDFYYLLGKPSKPKGPIDISDVHKEGCTLKWGEPEDDGGCPIEYYEIEKMDEETGVWVPAGKSPTPQCDLTNLTPGKKYKFRVRAVNREGDSEELETDKAILAKNPFGNFFLYFISFIILLTDFTMRIL